MTRTLTVLAFAAMVAMLTACAQYQPVKATETRKIGGVFEVQPMRTWSRATSGNTEVWTVNGVPLQSITFITAIADGEPIVEKARGAREDPPEYRAGMTALDVANLFEASLLTTRYSQIATANLRPVESAGGEAFMFDYTAYDPEGLLKSGFVYALMQPEKGLSLVFFEAADEYYYDAFRRYADQIFASIRVI